MLATKNALLIIPALREESGHDALLESLVTQGAQVLVDDYIVLRSEGRVEVPAQEDLPTKQIICLARFSTEAEKISTEELSAGKSSFRLFREGQSCPYEPSAGLKILSQLALRSTTLQVTYSKADEVTRRLAAEYSTC